jgi:hypothetical protein
MARPVSTGGSTKIWIGNTNVPLSWLATNTPYATKPAPPTSAHSLSVTFAAGSSAVMIRRIPLSTEKTV